MTTKDSDITITIEGPVNSGKTLVANVVHSALNKAGFTDITTIDQQGEDIVQYEPLTMLDTIKQARPELFTTPIVIEEISTNYNKNDDDNGDDPDGDRVYAETVVRVERDEEEISNAELS